MGEAGIVLLVGGPRDGKSVEGVGGTPGAPGYGVAEWNGFDDGGVWPSRFAPEPRLARMLVSFWVESGLMAPSEMPAGYHASAEAAATVAALERWADG